MMSASDSHDRVTTATPRRWKAYVRWTVAPLALAGIVLLVLSGPSVETIWEILHRNLNTWRQQTEQDLPIAIVVFFAAYAGATALSIPTLTCMTLLAGALFGRWLGTLVASLAYTLGATLAFLLARFLFKERLRRRFGPWLQRIDRRIQLDGAVFLLTLRLMPSMPFFLVNTLMGVTKMRLPVYVAISWLGILPITFLITSVGRELATIESPSNVLSTPIILSLVALALFPLAMRGIVRRIQLWRRHNPDPLLMSMESKL